MLEKKFSSYTLAFQKAGMSWDEYEDASYSDYPGNKPIIGKKKIVRFAIADGATESSFSNMWAGQLAKAYCQNDKFDDSILQTLRIEWQKEISSKPLPWFAAEKVRQGAYATFCGLTLIYKRGSHDFEGKWFAHAVGDCLLVHISDNQIINIFPILSSDHLTNYPPLISSIQQPNNNLLNLLQIKKGVWKRFDVFYLMTDALAHWFLQQIENGGKPWELLNRFKKNSIVEFQTWVSQLREKNQMRNDDVTMLKIELN